jgi:hypothetical protein
VLSTSYFLGQIRKYVTPTFKPCLPDFLEDSEGPGLVDFAQLLVSKYLRKPFMATKYGILSVPALGMIFLAACTTISTQGPLFSQRVRPADKIPLKDFNIVYKDWRQRVDARQLNIPTLTVSGNQDRIQPKIGPKWDRMFTETVNRLREPGNADLLILVDILEAYQAFKAKKYSEIEYAGAKLKVRVLERTTNQILAESEGACWGSKKTLDASQKSIDAMFWDALELAFLDALNGISKERLVVAKKVAPDHKGHPISSLREPPSVAATETPPNEKSTSGHPRTIQTSSLNKPGPSVEIFKVESNPQIVPPQDKFDLVMEYAVRDTSTKADEIPVEFGYSIFIGDKCLFDATPVTLKAFNGRPMRRVVHLKAAREKGHYTIRTFLRYNEKVAEEVAGLEID